MAVAVLETSPLETAKQKFILGDYSGEILGVLKRYANSGSFDGFTGEEIRRIVNAEAAARDEERRKIVAARIAANQVSGVSTSAATAAASSNATNNNLVGTGFAEKVDVLSGNFKLIETGDGSVAYQSESGRIHSGLAIRTRGLRATLGAAVAREFADRNGGEQMHRRQAAHLLKLLRLAADQVDSFKTTSEKTLREIAALSPTDLRAVDEMSAYLENGALFDANVQVGQRVDLSSTIEPLVAAAFEAPTTPTAQRDTSPGLTRNDLGPAAAASGYTLAG